MALLVSLFGCGSKKEVDQSNAIEFLKDAKDIKIYSLNPSRLMHTELNKKGVLGSWKILSEKNITDAIVIRNIYSALRESLIYSNVNAAACFNPRHAVSAEGRTIYISFECSGVKIDDKEYLIDDDGEHTFLKIWKKYEMKKPKE